MRQLVIYIPIYTNKLYKFVKAKLKKKRTHFSLEVPLEMDDVQGYEECVAKTIKLMEHNIKILQMGFLSKEEKMHPIL